MAKKTILSHQLVLKKSLDSPHGLLQDFEQFLNTLRENRSEKTKPQTLLNREDKICRQEHQEFQNSLSWTQILEFQGGISQGIQPLRVYE